MSQKVNAVPDASFSVPPLTTTAGTRVSRRRIKVPCNYPGTNYGHNGQSSLPSVVTFDIADNESFMDMDKSLIVLDFKPEFFGSEAQSSMYHNIGFDGSSQSILARVRIGNSQGLIIEECQAYGTWANIMDSYSQSEDQSQHHLYDRSSGSKNEEAHQKGYGSSELSAPVLRSHKYERLYLRLKHSSFLKSCRMIPLFLMRNGIRFEIEFENVYKSLTRHISPSWQGPYFANVTGVSNPSLSDSPATQDYLPRNADYWFTQRTLATADSNEISLIVKHNSKLAHDLKLRELLLQNINPVMNMGNEGASSISVPADADLVYKHRGYWSLPLKAEYTDELGTKKVLWQGVGLINFVPYMIQSSLLSTTQMDSDKIRLAWLSNPVVDGGQDFALNMTGNWVWGYEIILSSKYENGFDYILRDSTGGQQAFLPYVSQDLCLYVDPSDMAKVPATPRPAIGTSIRTGISGTSYTPTWTVDNLLDQPRYAHWGVGNSPWNYSVKNVEMICDFVKPSSEVFLQFQQSFQAPAGIPYAYKRVLYHTRVINPSEGLQQISLPVSVRSLRGIVCVLSDKLAWSPSSDYSSKSFNALSSFMKRGLIRAQLVIGGQNYPSYDLNLTENGFEQIPEMECLFNVAGLGSFNPSFDQKELQSTRNYLAGCGKTSAGTNAFDGGWVNVTDHTTNSSKGIQEYQDTSKFVLGLSTMKKDGDFVTGVDTSQAGSVSLNLFFKRSRDKANMYPGDSGSNRDIFVQVFCLADAVFTLQNDANLVRY